MAELYDHPEYYEIAFSFRDIPVEVSVFEECFRRFSRNPVKSVLELGCGNSPHMEELVKRGYEFNGLDLSWAMLEYSRQKASRIGAEVNLVLGDMADFSLPTKFDFVFIMLGSLSLNNTAQLITHFDSVARVLETGGLYFLDWCIQYETPFEAEGGDSWEMERGDIHVKATIYWKAINRVEQTFEEKLLLEVDDHGKRLEFVGTNIKRAIYPQEILLFVSGRPDFEFLGWWNNWDLSRPLSKAEKIDRPIALLRRL